MVLSMLTRLVPGGLSGLAQGGGFGLGYGFMVRAGYDLYGALRDRLTSNLTALRYTPDSGHSMIGTGGLMGLARTNNNAVNMPFPVANASPGGSPSPMGQSKIDRMQGIMKAGSYRNWLASKKGSGPSHQVINPNTRRLASDWYVKNVHNPRKERRQKYYNHKSFYDTFGFT